MAFRIIGKAVLPPPPESKGAAAVKSERPTAADSSVPPFPYLLPSLLPLRYFGCKIAGHPTVRSLHRPPGGRRPFYAQTMQCRSRPRPFLCSSVGRSSFKCGVRESDHEVVPSNEPEGYFQQMASSHLAGLHGVQTFIASHH